MTDWSQHPGEQMDIEFYAGVGDGDPVSHPAVLYFESEVDEDMRPRRDQAPPIEAISISLSGVVVNDQDLLWLINNDYRASLEEQCRNHVHAKIEDDLLSRAIDRYEDRMDDDYGPRM